MYGHLRHYDRGDALGSDVVGQPQSEYNYRAYLNHTLFGAACDFRTAQTRVLHELGMRQYVEEERTWE